MGKKTSLWQSSFFMSTRVHVYLWYLWQELYFLKYINYIFHLKSVVENRRKKLIFCPKYSQQLPVKPHDGHFKLSGIHCYIWNYITAYYTFLISYIIVGYTKSLLSFWRNILGVIQYVLNIERVSELIPFFKKCIMKI